jgi:hypothetical protein
MERSSVLSEAQLARRTPRRSIRCVADRTKEGIIMKLNCPRCAYQHDISGRTAGDRLWCAFCDRWLMLAFHRGGSAYFVIVQAPATYPRERR